MKNKYFLPRNSTEDVETFKIEMLDMKTTLSYFFCILVFQSEKPNRHKLYFEKKNRFDHRSKHVLPHISL